MVYIPTVYPPETPTQDLTMFTQIDFEEPSDGRCSPTSPPRPTTLLLEQTAALLLEDVENEDRLTNLNEVNKGRRRKKRRAADAGSKKFTGVFMRLHASLHYNVNNMLIKSVWPWGLLFVQACRICI